MFRIGLAIAGVMALFNLIFNNSFTRERFRNVLVCSVLVGAMIEVIRMVRVRMKKGKINLGSTSSANITKKAKAF